MKRTTDGLSANERHMIFQVERTELIPSTFAVPTYAAPVFTRTVSLMLSIAEALLAFRFLFKLAGASTDALFVWSLYLVTKPLRAPFAGAFPDLTLRSEYVFEFTTIIAMIVYALVAWFAVQFVTIRELHKRNE